MSLDEQLPDLLAREAEHADAAPPTMHGVEAVIGRRARRRQRQRLVGTGLAALCVVAGIAGGLALAGDDAAVGPVDGPVLPDVPLVGVDVSGLTLTDAERGPLGEGDTGGSLVYAVFTDPSGDLSGPVITAGIDPDIEPFEPLTREDGVPVDLDGDAMTDGPGDGRLLAVDGGVSLLWLTEDGRRAGVGGAGINEDFLLEYVRGLDRAAFDVRSMPTPTGLSHREVVAVPTDVGAEQAYAQYEGQGGSLVLLVTNAPGWFDLTRTGVASDSDEPPEQVTLGPSPLGPGTALLGTDQNTTTAVALTDSGLTVQITAFDLSPDLIRDILAGGRFVEIEPTEQPVTTTALDPVTPTTVMGSVPTTSIADRLPPLPQLERTVDAEGEHFVLEFADFQATVGELTLLEALTGDCAQAGVDFEGLWRERGGEPYWRGWLTVELDTRFAGVEGPVFGVDAEPAGYVLCTNDVAPAVIAIPLANLGEPTVTPLSGLPQIVIDIPAA